MRFYFHKASVFILTAIVLAIPTIVSADTLYISPAFGSYSPGQTFTVRVFVSSQAQSINAVSGTVSFPADKLQVLSVSKLGSILTLWVQDPSYSNSQGTIAFEGVVPNPGFIGSAGDIATITFRVLGQGSADVKWTSGSVLANDGNGTNILKNLNNAVYSLGSSPVSATAPSADAGGSKADPLLPSAPVVVSSSYPDSKHWFSERKGSFSWDVGKGISTARVLLGRLPSSQPTVVYTPAIASKEIPDIEDGSWYLHVQFKNAHGWGPTTHYAFKVDGTKPESFTIKALDDGDLTNPKPRFNFAATDGVSGIDHYSAQIDLKESEIWRDDGSGIYSAQNLLPGKHTLIARAYDLAGNFTDATVDFNVQGIEIPVISSYNEQVNDQAPLVVKGTALPGVVVKLSLVKDGKTVYGQTAAADERGAFTAVFDSNLESGTYKLSAIAVDRRGAVSDPSPSKIVLVKISAILALASSVIGVLAIAVPIAALVFVFAFISFYGYHKIRVMRKKVSRELRDIERMVDKAFALLKEDIEDSIHLLEHTKSKRKLTEEENTIINRLRKNLTDAEKVIHKEVEDIERDIQG